jgi:hypothetical protein
MGKLSDVTGSVSEKATNLSSNSLNQREGVPESVKKFYLIKSLVKLLLKDLPNISSLIQITETWIQELAKLMDDNSLSPEDLKTTLSFDSSGKSLVIRHELDGIRAFSMIQSFYLKVKSFMRTGLKDFQKKEKFLTSLCPLTLSFYLKLEEQVDFGFGVEKPVDRKQMTAYLAGCKEGGNIGKWTTSTSNQPIPTSLWVSSVDSSRFLNFYIFDGLKNQNIEKGFSLFEEFGAPVSGELAEMFRISKADEVNCVVQFDETTVKSLQLMIQTNDNCEHFLDKVDSRCDLEKWNTFHNLAPASFLAVELNSTGFSLKKVSIL